MPAYIARGRNSLINGSMIRNSHELKLQQSKPDQCSKLGFFGGQWSIHQLLQLPLQPVMPAQALSYQRPQQSSAIVVCICPASIVGGQRTAAAHDVSNTTRCLRANPAAVAATSLR